LWNLIFRSFIPPPPRIDACIEVMSTHHPGLILTILSCSVLSLQYLTTTVIIIAIPRGELNRKRELAVVHMCVLTLYYYILLYGQVHTIYNIYTKTVYNMYVGTKTGERPLLHRLPPKLLVRVSR